MAESGQCQRIALVAETAADARDVMVEGNSGILACCPEASRPIYEPSKRRLTWPNGAQAFMFNGTEPDQLRGPQFDGAWVDELAKYRYATEAWDQLQFGLRLGPHPRVCVTTTPRPVPVIRMLLADPTTHPTRGSTMDNAENLAAPFLRRVTERYAGTRLGRQELEAEMLDDVPGALWTRARIDDALRRREGGVPDFQRVVVAVDPSGTRGVDVEEGRANQVGIVIAAKGVDGRGYVLGDWSCDMSPAGWGARAVAAYHQHNADRIVAERNFGGAMVEFVIRTADPEVPYEEVVASRGKVVRAEPVAALYEQGRVSHVASMPELEDQMCEMTPDGFMGDGSPDRVDALVWALSFLMLDPEQIPMRVSAEALAAVQQFTRRGRF